jgi:molybdopterin synthase catalytic subunit
MAERELACIAEEAAREYGTEHIVIEHRLGHLALGEASVAIAVAHPRRAQAYDASRFVIEQLKRRVPIWKREEYVDGTREWVASGLGTRDAAIEIRDSSIEARHGGADGSSRESRAPSPAEHP